MSEEDRKKKQQMVKKYMGKIEDMFEEIAEDLLDEDIKTKLYKAIKQNLSEAGVPMGTENLKAFYEGVKMAQHAVRADGGGENLLFTLLIGTKNLIGKSGNKVKKVADQAMKENLK